VSHIRVSTTLRVRGWRPDALPTHRASAIVASQPATLSRRPPGPPSVKTGSRAAYCWSAVATADKPRVSLISAPFGPTGTESQSARQKHWERYLDSSHVEQRPRFLRAFHVPPYIVLSVSVSAPLQAHPVLDFGEGSPPGRRVLDTRGASVLNRSLSTALLAQLGLARFSASQRVTEVTASTGVCFRRRCHHLHAFIQGCDEAFHRQYCN
jgi:hypothetical protein